MPRALTDDQLRATPVPVSGTIGGTVTVIGALTDTQLRAAAVPVSGVDAEQETATANPVLVGGVDDSGAVQTLPIVPSSAFNGPTGNALPMRAPLMEQALEKLITQNVAIIQLLQQIAVFCDPTHPAASLQTNPPDPIIGDAWNAVPLDTTPIQ